MIATFFAAADQERTHVGTANDSGHRTIVARNDWDDVVGTLQKVVVEAFRWFIGMKQSCDWRRDILGQRQLTDARIKKAFAEDRVTDDSDDLVVVVCHGKSIVGTIFHVRNCLLYTSDAADE